MTNQCITDAISVTDKRIDTSFEIGLDREILLADYDKPVFKIVKTIAEHSITQKYINGNRLIIEGFFRTSIFYQPPSGEGLTVVSKKQTFQKQIDLQTPVTDVYFIDISGSAQYINTRAVNPTRISINGVYSFDITMHTTENIPVATAVNSPTVCADSGNISFFSLRGRGTRQFSVEDELSVEEKTEKILYISACPVNVQAVPYQDKVNIKGDIEAEIVLFSLEKPTLQTVKKKFPFNQICDIQSVTENNVAYTYIDVISTTVTANKETGKINCIIAVTADVKVFRKNTVICLLDGFSKKYHADKKLNTIQYDKNILSVDKTMSCTIEDTLGSGYTPVYSFVNISQPYISATEGKHCLKATVSANAIVLNSQKEYECFTKTGDITIETAREITPQDKLFLNCAVKDKSLTVMNSTMKLDFTVDTKGFILNTQSQKMLESFAEDTASPLENSNNCLVLYYGTKGEKVFDIAMKYNTDTQLILAENSITGECLDRDKMLIIPSFGM